MTSTSRACMAVAALLFLAAPATAQQIRLERPGPWLLELSADTGSDTWRLTYGTSRRSTQPAAVYPASPGRAYFSHGAWLRFIDVSKGVVLKRWRLPNTIQAVTPNSDGTVTVEFLLQPWAAAPSATVTFDPTTGAPPDWDVGALATYRHSEWEVLELVQSATGLTGDLWLAPFADAAKAIPLVENLVTREPMAAMPRLALAKLLTDTKDSRASEVLAGLRTTDSDFAEGFKVAAIVDHMGDTPLANELFERAYADFIRRGRDPRLVDTLIARMILFSPAVTWTNVTADDRKRQMERMYRVAPTTEGTDRAWSLYADVLENSGDPDAAVWRERAAASSREMLLPPTIELQRRHDQLTLLTLGSIIASLLLIVITQINYAPQRRMRAAAAARGRQQGSTFLGLAYWSGRERWSLLAFAAIGWLAIGLSWSYTRVLIEGFWQPTRVGTISALEQFDRRYPPSAERELLQAIALQMGGQLDEAAARYRNVPQFAESWNNLGVIHAAKGQAADSQQAFERARSIDPGMPEGILNTTGEARDFTTQMFKKYMPDAKMIALPSRERWLAARSGSVWTNRYARTLLGPLDAFNEHRDVPSFVAPALMPPLVLGGIVVGLLLLLSLALISVIPFETPSVPPGRSAAISAMVIPGSAAWKGWGAPALLVWSTVLLGLVLQLSIGSPYLLLLVGQPGMNRPYGFPPGIEDLNPSVLVLFAVFLAISAVNILLVRARNRASR